MIYLPVRGRGASENPSSRFERISLELNPEHRQGNLRTEFLEDRTRSILSRNNSPDLPFRFSLNPYRGCEHGCVYCYARPTHEYLGFSTGLDFESRILVKRNAPALLRSALGRPGWKAEVIVMSGVTDPYQPVERKLRVTRGCLEVLAEATNPVAIITKNHLVERDADLLGQMAKDGAAHAMLSVTTLRRELQRVMEPRTSIPARRLDAISALAGAGVPVGVMVAPVIPGLNDSEIPQILQAAAGAGATFASFVLLRLPRGVREHFLEWLRGRFPEREGKVLSRICEARGGRLNDSNFGSRFRGSGPYQDSLRRLFRVTCRRTGLARRPPRLRTDGFLRPSANGDLFAPGIAR